MALKRTACYDLIVEYTSKHQLKALRRRVREALATYLDVRAAALMAGRQARARKTSGTRLVLEDAIGEVWGARHDLRNARARLAKAEAAECVPHGGRMSPAAIERLRDVGRLIQEKESE